MGVGLFPGLAGWFPLWCAGKAWAGSEAGVSKVAVVYINLIMLLDDGPLPARAVLARGKEWGCCERTLRRAKAILPIVSVRESDRWYWALPHQVWWTAVGPRIRWWEFCGERHVGGPNP